MDIYYLKDHICEELDGAHDYLMQAMHTKDEHPEWAKTLYDMSSMELEHARSLYKMFTDYFKQINTDPKLEAYMTPFRDDVERKFTERVGAIKYMQEMYK